MTKRYRCIIVDDEPPAIRLLENFVQQVPFLELVGTYTNPLNALKEIEQNAADLAFLDIQMPQLTGLQLSKILPDNLSIILTTAYPQFALQSYDLNALDYLLKPFEFDRFYTAVSKMKTSITIHSAPEESETEYLFVKTDGKNNFEKIVLSEITYVEGAKNYVSIHLSNRRIITYNTLKHIMDNLPPEKFFQVHKSYLVNFDHITRTTTYEVCIGEVEIPLGKTYKEAFFQKIQNKKL